MCRNACRPPTVRVTIVFIVVEGTHDTERFLGTTPFAEGWSYCCAVAVYSVVQYMLSLMKLVATESPGGPYQSLTGDCLTLGPACGLISWHSKPGRQY